MRTNIRRITSREPDSHIVIMPVKGPESHAKSPDPLSGTLTLRRDSVSFGWSEPYIENGHRTDGNDLE